MAILVRKDEELTGRWRIRQGFRGRLVIQVEYRVTRPYGMDEEVTERWWRDAKLEDLDISPGE